MRRRIASAIFALALLSFLPPWFAVEIGGRRLIDFTGTELAFGTRFSASSPAAFLGSVQPQLSVLFAAVCGAAALLTGLSRRSAGSVAATSAAAGAIAGLLVERVLFPNILMLRAASVVEISGQTGYYLALALFVAGAICAAPSVLAPDN